MKILVKNANFGQKWKNWSKGETFLVKIENFLVKKAKFGQKFKFSQRLKFWLKIQILKSTEKMLKFGHYFSVLSKISGNVSAKKM